MSVHCEGKTLASLRKGESATVVGLQDVGRDNAALRMRLLELGFVAGERVRVVAESFPSRDPIAVRIGNTTFALRRHEAAMIHIDHPAAGT
ncbi:ferrous iron transport protein A [Oxalobacteraceae bacterium OM1]|nr:ferrous iron transport protein A [Oxalobacteraceae bacterium OM1]